MAFDRLLSYRRTPHATYAFATPRNAAASLAIASCARPLPTRECSKTGKRGSSGNPNFSPTSSAPRGSIRFAKAETPKPAVTAAETAATPPPTNASVHDTPASSRTCPAITRTPHGSASVASGSGSPARCCQVGEAYQPNLSWASTSPSVRPT